MSELGNHKYEVRVRHNVNHVGMVVFSASSWRMAADFAERDFAERTRENLPIVEVVNAKPSKRDRWLHQEGTRRLRWRLCIKDDGSRVWRAVGDSYEVIPEVTR